MAPKKKSPKKVSTKAPQAKDVRKALSSALTKAFKEIQAALKASGHWEQPQ